MASLPPEIEAFPPAPQRKNKDTFADLMDDVITWFSRSVSKLGAACISAYQNAVAAAASASAAAAAAEAAIYTSGATQWVSGTTYAKGAVVWSPTDGRSYRRLVAGGGTADPGHLTNPDTANWVVLSRVSPQVIHVQGRNTTEYGNAGQNPPLTRVLNTVVVNTMVGASLANNVVTLPAGTYDVAGFAAGAYEAAHTANARNVDDGVSLTFGFMAGNYPSTFTGRFTIDAPKKISLYHNISNNGFCGGPLSAEIRFTRVQ